MFPIFLLLTTCTSKQRCREGAFQTPTALLGHARSSTSLYLEARFFVNCRHSDLSDEECFRLLELYRSALTPHATIKSGNYQTPETCQYEQRESYHLVLLNLSLGNINRQPVTGGNVRFLKHIREDPDCVVLPHLVLRNGAHIISLCEASDNKEECRSIKRLACENAMLGMVLQAETTAQSIGLFIRGTQEDGNFIELLSQYQHESQGTQNPDKKFWTFHAYIFRVSFGHVASGEMIDPTTGIWTSIGN